MSDLTHDELHALQYHGCSSGTSTQPIVREAIVRAVAELQRHRAALAADKERVCSVVREAAGATLNERKLFIVMPQAPTMSEIALEAYGHGRACDAVALQGEELQAVLAAIADRAAEQLATPYCTECARLRAQISETARVREDDERRRDELDRYPGAGAG